MKTRASRYGRLEGVGEVGLGGKGGVLRQASSIPASPSPCPQGRRWPLLASTPPGSARQARTPLLPPSLPPLLTWQRRAGRVCALGLGGGAGVAGRGEGGELHGSLGLGRPSWADEAGMDARDGVCGCARARAHFCLSCLFRVCRAFLCLLVLPRSLPRRIAPAPALPAHSTPAGAVPSSAARLCAYATAGGRVTASRAQMIRVVCGYECARARTRQSGT